MFNIFQLVNVISKSFKMSNDGNFFMQDSRIFYAQKANKMILNMFVVYF